MRTKVTYKSIQILCSKLYHCYLINKSLDVQLITK